MKSRPPAIVVILSGLVGFGILFGAFGVGAGDYGKFLLGLFLFVYAPGRALLDILRISRPPLVSGILVPAAGMAAVTFVNKYTRLLHVEFFFFAAVAAASVYVLWKGERRARMLLKKRLHITRTGLILTACFLALTAFLWIDGYRNGIAQPDGSVVVRMHYYDGFIRNAVILELAHNVPPEMPFAAGVPLGYHYGMDLFVSLFVRYLDLGVFDLVFRLAATFFWSLLLLSIFLFARVLFDSERTGVAAAILVVFGGGGFTWIATLARGTPLGGNPFYALYVFDALGVNSLVPGFALAFCGLAALIAYLRERRVSELILAAFLLAAAVEFKVFLGPPLIGVLLVTGIIARVLVREGALLRAAGAVAVGLIPLGWTAFAASGGGFPYHYALKLIDWPGKVLADLQLETGLGLWNGAIREGRITAAAAAVVVAACVLTLLGALGPGLIAVPRMVRDFFAGPKNASRFFTAGLAAACFLYFLVFEVRLGSLDRTILNVYVYYFGLMLVLIYTADVLVRLPKKRSCVPGTVLIAAVLALTLPNTVLFLQQKLKAPETRTFSASFIQACRWLKENTPAEAVILQPLNIRHLCYFAGRRVVLDDSVNSYLDFHLSEEEISRRRDRINRFFSDPLNRTEVFSAYGVSHVLRSNDGPFPDAPDGNLNFGPGDRGRGMPTGLTRIFQNEGFTIYRVEK